MKFGIDILYETLLRKFDFHENRFSESRTLLKGVNILLPLISIVIDRCR
jgi:hypothetical protein